ncbi:Lsr2 family protein [Microbacterium sp. NPDC087589]|uniref:histone-like nucleoid-structuring protein Lsr2 n=1 Tax=Microbacterium sp. NPDC087589 TaxID=3364191 RepID=UPI0037F459C3
MAQRRIVEFIDDLDQTTIEDGGTLTFALNETVYEIDLSSANEDKLREALAPFIKAGRRVRPIRSRRTSSVKSSAPPSADERRAIRVWARDNGYSVSDRGRIAADIVAAYREA